MTRLLRAPKALRCREWSQSTLMTLGYRSRLTNPCLEESSSTCLALDLWNKPQTSLHWTAATVRRQRTRGIFTSSTLWRAKKPTLSFSDEPQVQWPSTDCQSNQSRSRCQSLPQRAMSRTYSPLLLALWVVTMVVHLLTLSTKRSCRAQWTLWAV